MAVNKKMMNAIKENLIGEKYKIIYGGYVWKLKYMI